MKKVFAVVLVFALLLTGCASSGKSGKQRVVNVCNWGEYIDESLIDEFEKQTGIKVNYKTAESNEALYSILKTGGADYDVITPSDYMVAQLIEEGMLQELNYDHIPNYKLIGDKFKGLEYDPENKYTVPYMWGTLGIIYNESLVDTPITGWDALFDERYAGNVLMIRNSRDAFGVALMQLGYSINTTDPKEIEEAYELVAEAKNKGVYQSFVMDEVFGKMEGGNAAICTYYAGDYLSMLENNEDLRFVLPEKSNWFVDCMVILKDAQNVSEAEEWINFLASTESNLANMDCIYYASPNDEALEQYPDYYYETYGEELDPELFAILAASDEQIAQCEVYTVLPSDIRTLYNDLWTKLGI